ncbi:MAG: hypothetical protein GJ676_09280 [Rhodobacteraceae bacterium]|nr:hypothetical protein [Paracoccaceae bacterium]
MDNRKLLTILAADIAGYSRHVERDETNALEQLSHLRGYLDPLIEEHGGTIANTAGDSVIACFESPVAAVEAAIAYQKAQKIHNEAIPEAERLEYRIGLNIGDVTIQQNGDVLGHGVNIAARLEALAEPGGICFAANVMDQVEGKIEFEFTKVGEHRVKNIDKPIVVYSVGASEHPLVERIVRLAKSRIQKPIFQFGFLGILIVALSLWVLVVQPNRKFVPSLEMDLPAFLATEPTPEELLSFFDLVTEGEFGGSKYYVIRTWSAEWDFMLEIAEILGGYPVAIGSEKENQFVYELTLEDEGHWMVTNGGYFGPMIGLVQRADGTEPAGGWEWANGEPVEYVNWKVYGPDNTNGNQEFAVFGVRRNAAPGPTWNDMDEGQHGFIVEVPM